MNDYLQNKFIEEAGDLITDLEQSLLELEGDPGSPTLVDRIFRALHTLKGSGAMFGYHLISDFTHDLENLYDDIRTQKNSLTKDIMDMTLQSVDLIRKLLYEPTKDIAGNKVRIDEISGNIRKITGKNAKNYEAELAKSISKSPEVEILDERKVYIRFSPGRDIMKNGNNPLFLLDELYELGTCTVKCFLSDIPDYESIDVHQCYIRWEAEVLTKASIGEIKEVFLFVEDHSEISISETPPIEIKEEPVIETIDVPKEELEVDVDVAPLIEEEKIAPFHLPANTVNTVNTIRVSSVKLDQLMNLVSELVTMQARLELLVSGSENPEALALAEGMQKLSRQLRDTTFEICMVPLQSIVTRFQRLVRDLGKDVKKEIIFVTEGMETELDKNIIENITDPLLHIIRNCIDHGIESAEKRKKTQKPINGTITLRAYHSGPHVIIEVIDDGAGINDELVVKKAIKKGLISPNAVLTQNEIWDILFLPGFTTTAQVTAISGRGVGLDVVKQQVNSLRGSVSVKSELGKGTSFKIKLPLILSIIDGLLVEVSSERFIIPLELVSKIMVYKQELLSGSYQNLITYNGRKIPFFNLREEFSITTPPPTYMEIVIVNYLGEEVGLAVDRVIGEQQAVIKPLGKIFYSVNLFSGATILGDGNVALVLDIQRMIHELAKATAFVQ